jgi:hypothetical protein
MNSDTPSLREPKQTDGRSLEHTRDAARITVKAYLDLAKSSGQSYQASCLEAIAIERALIADILGELVDRDQLIGDKSSDGKCTVTAREADEKLFEASYQLYRQSGNEEVKNFARELRFSIFGFGQFCVL